MTLPPMLAMSLIALQLIAPLSSVASCRAGKMALVRRTGLRPEQGRPQLRASRSLAEETGAASEGDAEMARVARAIRVEERILECVVKGGK